MQDSFDISGFVFVIVTLLTLAHVFGYLFEHFRLPRVIGEICAGIVLGPSVLGLFGIEFLDLSDNTEQSGAALVHAVYWLGLILLMIVSGFRISGHSVGSESRIIGLLFVASTFIPMTCALLVSPFFNLEQYMGPSGTELKITIIFCIAVAVTSIPVISKIFLDLNLMKTRFARIVLVSSTLQDVVLWSGVAVALGLTATSTKSEDLAIEGITAVTVTLFFCAFGIALTPIGYKAASKVSISRLLLSSKLGFILAWCFLLVALASVLNVNLIFGALVAGVGIGLLGDDRLDKEKRQISAFSLGFFVPIYFAIVGYQIDLVHSFDPALFFGFLLFSSAIEMVCVFAAMRLARFNALTSFNFSMAMNTRGGPGIVLASVSYQFGIIDERLYVALVLSAIVTSLISGTWFRAISERGLSLMPERNTPPK